MKLLLDKMFLEKMQLLCLCFTILFLPITMLPAKYQIMFIGGNLANYPLFLGLIVFLIYIVKYDVKLPKYMKYYMLIYALWCIVTSIYGAIAYPYYEHINIFDSPKIVKILSFLGLEGNNNNIIMIIMCVRSFKIVAFEFSRTFLITIWVFTLFRNRFEYGFLFIRKYFMVLIGLLCIYAIFEVVYFKFDALWAKNFLETLNPFFYDVKSYMGWYPPLILYDKVRSFCTEPGELGAYLALSLPFLWSYMCENKKYTYLFYAYIVYLGFATKARTATLFIILNTCLLPFYLFFQNKINKVLFLVVTATTLGFALNIMDWSFGQTSNFLNLNNKNITRVTVVDKTTNVKKLTQSGADKIVIYGSNRTMHKAKDYFDKNIATIVSTDKRSNSSRLIVLKRNFEVIIDKWFMGTGYGFKGWYVKEKMNAVDLKNWEIKKIKDTMEKKGIFVVDYSGGYLFTTAINLGLIGLFLYCLPLLSGVYLTVKRKYYKNLYILTILTILVTLYSRQFICSSMTITYILLGLLYVALDCKKVEANLSNE